MRRPYIYFTLSRSSLSIFDTSGEKDFGNRLLIWWSGLFWHFYSFLFLILFHRGSNIYLQKHDALETTTLDGPRDFFGQSNQSNASTPMPRHHDVSKSKILPETIFIKFGNYENLFFPKSGFWEQVMMQNCYKKTLFGVRDLRTTTGDRPGRNGPRFSKFLGPVQSKTFKILLVRVRSGPKFLIFFGPEPIRSWTNGFWSVDPNMLA